MPRYTLVIFFVLISTSVFSAPSPEAQVEKLLTLLDANNTNSHSVILNRIVQLGAKTLPALEENAIDPETRIVERMGAIWVIGEIDDPRSLQILNELWQSLLEEEQEETLQIQVAMALGRQGDPTALRTFLEKDDLVLVAKASISLGRLKDKESLPIIRSLFKREEIAPFIAMALAYLGDNSGEELLKGFLNDSVMRDYAAVALAHLDNEDVLFELRFAIFNQHDPELRLDAIKLIVKRKDKGAVSDLERLLKDEQNPQVKEAAEQALTELRKKPRRKRR